MLDKHMTLDMDDRYDPRLSPMSSVSPTRVFSSGAFRDQDTDKYDYEGFLCPLVMTRFAEHMHENRTLADETTRASDNWQKGIPHSVYMKSLWRHLMAVWRDHRGVSEDEGEGLESALCGVIFNAQGYLHEVLKEKQIDESVPF